MFRFSLEFFRGDPQRGIWFGLSTYSYFSWIYERIFATLELRGVWKGQYKQIVQYIQLLADHGTRPGTNITKHLDENIWELCPGNNRVLYFFHQNDTYVLLHYFRKRTQKTPMREIEKAKAERDNWLSRGGDNYGNMGRL